MDTGFNKLQWSKFVKDGADEQYVVRADSIAEFKELKKGVLEMINGKETTTPNTPKEPTRELSCETCSAPAQERTGIVKRGSRTGQPYRSIVCSSKIDSHTKWL